MRNLIAHKYDGSRLGGPGRFHSREDVAALIVRMAKENTSWRYTRIVGAPKNLEITISRTIVKHISKDHGYVAPIRMRSGVIETDKVSYVIVMPLHPQIQFIIDATNESLDVPMWEKTPEELRAFAISGTQKLAAYAPVVDLQSVVDRTIDGPRGKIPIRIYRPRGQGPFGGVTYLHGGGFAVGNIQTHDVVCRLLAGRSGCVVMSVDYRLAPEHPFPAGLEDSYTALCWLHDQAETLVVDRSRIAVAGDSAGANLAAVCTLLARNQKHPPLRYQILIYPSVDHSKSFPSLEAYSKGYLFDPELRMWFRNAYVTEDMDVRDYRVSPILADSHRDLPNALIVTAECDPLRIEAEAYARVLQQDGVEVEIHFCPGMIHGFILYQGVADGAGEALDRCAQALRESLG